MPEVIETRKYATYLCDNCLVGRMYPTGYLYDNLIEHQCRHCGEIKNFDKCYDSLWEEYG